VIALDVEWNREGRVPSERELRGLDALGRHSCIDGVHLVAELHELGNVPMGTR
jgi:hypothetical protein